MANLPPEATVTINGITLTTAESMTLRVAIASFLTDLSANGLGDDEHGKFMKDAYMRTGSMIQQLLINR